MASVKAFALGGLDEHGKDTFVIDVNGALFVFDNGLSFPDNEVLGVKKIIPDTSYLVANKQKIKGVFLTQDHEHVNAGLPYLLAEDLNPTVYGSPLSEFIMRQRMAKNALVKEVKFVTVAKNQELQFDNVALLAFPTFSEAMQSLGYALKVDGVVYIYMQDFVFSNDLNAAFNSDFGPLLRFIAGCPVALLTCGVNNVANQGYTSPSHKVKSYLDSQLRDFAGRVFLAVYQHDLYTIMSVVALARDLQRPLIIYGRTFEQRFDFLIKTGAIKTNNVIRLGAEKINETPNAMVLITGSTDRLFAKISKIATAYDQIIKVNQDDLFISLSPSVPGNEELEASSQDDMARTDVKIVVKPKRILPAKASAEDVKTFINMVKPLTIIPFGGLYRNQVEFGRTAVEAGFDKNGVKLLSNGEALIFDGAKLLKFDEKYLQLKEVYVDSVGVTDIGAAVLSERKQMATDGVAILAIGIDRNTHLPATTMEIQFKGVVSIEEENRAGIERIVKEVGESIATFAKLYPGNRFDMKELKMEVRKKATKMVEKILKKRPIILASIVEI